MTIIASTAENLARLGANIEITVEAKYIASTVENIVRIAKANNAHVTIHAGNYIASSLENFVRIGGSNVTIKI